MEYPSYPKAFATMALGRFYKAAFKSHCL